jgi:hypothetical protein
LVLREAHGNESAADPAQSRSPRDARRWASRARSSAVDAA